MGVVLSFTWCNLNAALHIVGVCICRLTPSFTHLECAVGMLSGGRSDLNDLVQVHQTLDLISVSLSSGLEPEIYRAVPKKKHTHTMRAWASSRRRCLPQVQIVYHSVSCPAIYMHLEWAYICTEAFLSCITVCLIHSPVQYTVFERHEAFPRSFQRPRAHYLDVPVLDDMMLAGRPWPQWHRSSRARTTIAPHYGKAMYTEGEEGGRRGEERTASHSNIRVHPIFITALSLDFLGT